ncbi:MAG: inositol-3-phosphate synthase [Planctomycetales bacterium]|nr:inositol-3-phosphate synthase [Planctomycetales bacterium]
MTGPLGVWLLGARGSVAATTVAGAAAIRRGVADRTGLVTALPAFSGLGLADPSEMVFGGHEVRGGTLPEEAEGLAGAGGIPPAVLAAARADLEAADARVRPGTLYGAGDGVRALAGAPAERRGAREVVEALRADLRAFRAGTGARFVVVVNLCSTDARRLGPSALPSAEALEDAIARDDSGRLSAVVLYATAALQEGCPFVNFTPAEATELPGLAALAAARGLPHCGKDGKTGETLVKTVLAPLFRDRHLKVLSWSGVNLLGNRDGEALRDPGANAAKVSDKDQVVAKVLGEPTPSLTRIDYVRSLGDWKTAWDLVHFAGFLGVRMSLQFTWQGCDSALAAPLVLDLVRLADLAHRRGEKGPMRHAAVFFKTPVGAEDHDFARQMGMLLEYAASTADVRKTSRGR